jgi:hypothetical protein
MPQTQLRRGDIVEVKSPAEILATLDEHGDLDALPFMEEMAAYCGKRFRVDRRADKVCDTVEFSGSRRLPSAILLDDLRCDGSGHDGCEAECRLFWKEEWLTPVEPDAPPPEAFPERDRAALIERVKRRARSTVNDDGREEVRYRCQATELPRCSEHLRTWDPRPYFRELVSGNVSPRCFLRVMTRAVVEEPRRKLGLLPEVWLTGNAKKGDAFETLGLQAGEMVRVRSREEIRRTLDDRGMNRGLRFDREMLPFCGRVFRVRRRLARFIDETKARMVVLKTDAVTLDGAVCAGELNPARWFCPRGIYAFWRECWVERVEPSWTTATTLDNA